MGKIPHCKLSSSGGKPPEIYAMRLKVSLEEMVLENNISRPPLRVDSILAVRDLVVSLVLRKRISNSCLFSQYPVIFFQ